MLPLGGDGRDHGTWASKVARRFGRLIRARIETRAFHPSASQEILGGNDAVFAVLRTAHEPEERVLALANVSARPQQASYPIGALAPASGAWRDLLSPRTWEPSSGELSLRLRPYEVLWLRAA